MCIAGNSSPARCRLNHVVYTKIMNSTRTSSVQSNCSKTFSDTKVFLGNFTAFLYRSSPVHAATSMEPTCHLGSKGMATETSCHAIRLGSFQQCFTQRDQPIAIVETFLSVWRRNGCSTPSIGAGEARDVWYLLQTSSPFLTVRRRRTRFPRSLFALFEEGLI